MVSASYGSSSVSEPWARRPTATGPRATRPSAFRYGPERPGSRQGLVSLHGFVRRRPAKGPTGLGRDSFVSHHGTVRRQARTATRARRGPASVHTAVRRWASQGRCAAREPHGYTGTRAESPSPSNQPRARHGPVSHHVRPSTAALLPVTHPPRTRDVELQSTDPIDARRRRGDRARLRVVGLDWRVEPAGGAAWQVTSPTVALVTSTSSRRERVGLGRRAARQGLTVADERRLDVLCATCCPGLPQGSQSRRRPPTPFTPSAVLAHESRRSRMLLAPPRRPRAPWPRRAARRARGRGWGALPALLHDGGECNS